MLTINNIIINYSTIALWILILALLCILVKIIFFFLPKILTKINNLIYRHPGLFSAISVLMVICVISKSTEKMLEALFNKYTTFVEASRGLSPLSKKELIAKGNEPIKIVKGNKNAVVIVHGAQQSPPKMLLVYSSPEFDNFDKFMPLLLYHRRSSEMINRLDYHEMSRQLLEDILYVVDQGYEKVFCCGHSLAGSLLCYLSLRGELPENVKLIFYAPAITTEIGYIRYILAYITSYFNKYVMHPEAWSEKFASLGYNFAEFLTPQKMLLVIFDSTITLSKMFKKNMQINNEFVCIIGEADIRVPSKGVSRLLRPQTLCKGINILKNIGHSPHIIKKEVAQLCACIGKAIKTLSEN